MIETTAVFLTHQLTEDLNAEYHIFMAANFVLKSSRNFLRTPPKLLLIYVLELKFHSECTSLEASVFQRRLK